MYDQKVSCSILFGTFDPPITYFFIYNFLGNKFFLKGGDDFLG